MPDLLPPPSPSIPSSPPSSKGKAMHHKPPAQPSLSKTERSAKRNKRLLKDGDIVVIEVVRAKEFLPKEAGKPGKVWLAPLWHRRLHQMKAGTLTGVSHDIPTAATASDRSKAARLRVHIGFENQKEQKGKKLVLFEILPYTYKSGKNAEVKLDLHPLSRMYLTDRYSE